MCLSERVRECAPGEQWPFDTDLTQPGDCGQRMSAARQSDWLLLSVGAGPKQDKGERLLLNHKDARILGLRKRRIQSGAREEA